MSLRDSWLHQIEIHLESGQSPILDLGIYARTVSGLPALITLRRLAMERTDVTKPTAIIGGDVGLWLAALMQERVSVSSHRLTPISIVYGGPDWATYLASQTTQIRETDLNAPGLPPALAPLFIVAQPQGMTNWWAFQPLTMLNSSWNDPRALQATALVNNPAHMQGNDSEVGMDEWHNWVGGVMAIALILFALIL